MNTKQSNADRDAKFGAYLKTARKKMGLTQAEFAKRSHIGIRTVVAIEKDDHKPNARTVSKIAIALNTDLKGLLERAGLEASDSEIAGLQEKGLPIETFDVRPEVDIKSLMQGLLKDNTRETIPLSDLLWLLKSQQGLGVVLSAESASALYKDYCNRR